MVLNKMEGIKRFALNNLVGKNIIRIKEDYWRQNNWDFQIVLLLI